jgi:predicted metal-dependent HD superfamily phosphohydrolase
VSEWFGGTGHRDNEATFLGAWAALAAELGLDPEPARELGLDLAARHGEPQRHYHTVPHIEAVLQHLERLHAATAVARLAAFFHDAIYDPQRADNEERSAELASEVLAPLGVSEASDVSLIVLATKAHTVAPGAPRETAAFLDADLAILGAVPAVYDEYVAGIRQEYRHVPDDVFATGRRSILQAFVDRDPLYFTSAGRALWEVQARANLRRELASLS